MSKDGKSIKLLHVMKKYDFVTMIYLITTLPEEHRLYFITNDIISIKQLKNVLNC